jgi:hypothetical protein
VGQIHVGPLGYFRNKLEASQNRGYKVISFFFPFFSNGFYGHLAGAPPESTVK